MTVKSLDVVGIGNAIVDVLVHADDAFLASEGLTKGTMALVDAEQAEQLYARLGAGLETSGGSAANTLAGVAQRRKNDWRRSEKKYRELHESMTDAYVRFDREFLFYWFVPLLVASHH